MKIRTNLVLNISFLMCFLLISCDPADNRLIIANKSNSDIYFFYSCDSSLRDLTIFRNGYYKDSAGDSVYVQSNLYVEKKLTRNIPKRGLNAWSNGLNSCEGGIIHFYIFTEQIANRYSDSEIIDKKMYDKHFTFTIKELKQNNWTITYP